MVATVGPSQGPCVALRADMDALPIQEATGLDFASEVPGVMHACGHDCHTAMLLGAARLLKSRESHLEGPVKLLFQPAEEGGAGGKRMHDEGALQQPNVQRIFGLHVWPLAPTGVIVSRPGPFMAACSNFELEVTGQGGHAAMPHLTRDPVSTACKIVVELQTLVSREFDPLQAGVVSVTSMRAGEAFNVIPSSALLRGTLRTLSMAELKTLQERLREMAEGVAQANRCRVAVRFPGEDYPPTVNDPQCWALVQRVGAQLLGQDSVLESPPVMGGEDFAYYLEEIPGCFVGLGIGNRDVGAVHSVHHPCFVVDEQALPTGAALHVALATQAQADLPEV